MWPVFILCLLPRGAQISAWAVSTAGRERGHLSSQRQGTGGTRSSRVSGAQLQRQDPGLCPPHMHARGREGSQGSRRCVLSEAAQPSVPLQPVRGQQLPGRREGAWLPRFSGPGLGRGALPGAEVNLLSPPPAPLPQRPAEL